MRGIHQTREIVKRMEMKNFSAQQIADALGITKQAVYEHLKAIKETEEARTGKK